MIKALLFDLDGVLIETERETFQFYKKYLKDHYHIVLKNSDFKYKAGRKSKNFFDDVLTPEQQKIVNIKKLTELKRHLFNTQISKYTKKIKGGNALLHYLQKHHYLLALVSQNEPQMIQNALKWLAIKHYFQTILSLADIKNKKPNPEIYLLAAKKLSLQPKECLVIEDSYDGVMAAKNGGFKCLALKHNYMPQYIYKKADKTIRELREINQILIKTL